MLEWFWSGGDGYGVGGGGCGVNGESVGSGHFSATKMYFFGVGPWCLFIYVEKYLFFGGEWYEIVDGDRGLMIVVMWMGSKWAMAFFGHMCAFL